MGKKNSTSKKLRKKVKSLEKKVITLNKPTHPIADQIKKAVLIGLDEKRVLDLAVDVWKLEKNIKKTVDIEENRPIKSSLNKLRDYIGAYKIETVDYDGEKYYENLNVKILSSEEKDNVYEPVVAETVKPAILLNGKLMSHASVIINIPKNSLNVETKEKKVKK
jgi:hypothetical protein